MKLEPGMLIDTNYSGPYRIASISRGCTCSSYLDELSGRHRRRSPHIHVICTRPDGTGEFYLNGWNEETLKSLEKTYCGMKKKLDYDVISVLPGDRPIQGTLF